MRKTRLYEACILRENKIEKCIVKTDGHKVLIMLIKEDGGLDLIQRQFVKRLYPVA